LGKHYVIPIAHALMEQHPDFSIELDLTERLAAPVLERLDAVSRFRQPGQRPGKSDLAAQANRTILRQNLELSCAS